MAIHLAVNDSAISHAGEGLRQIWGTFKQYRTALYIVNGMYTYIEAGLLATLLLTNLV